MNETDSLDDLVVGDHYDVTCRTEDWTHGPLRVEKNHGVTELVGTVDGAGVPMTVDDVFSASGYTVHGIGSKAHYGRDELIITEADQ